MGNKQIEQTDYRFGLGDKYGRANCGRCGKRRRINAHWQSKNLVMCRECSLAPGVAFATSLGGSR